MAAEARRVGAVAGAGVVLAGGRSTRMGSPKAGLEWHGSTLLAHVAGVLQAALLGPVVVVRAPGQRLPALPAGVRVCDDPSEGVGPLLGLVTGLRAVTSADRTFACATDMPWLQVAFVHRVLAALAAAPEAEVALPVVGGIPQPLAAGYRARPADVAERLLATGQHSLSALCRSCRALPLDEAALLADARLRAADPQLRSVRGLNTAEEYAAARAVPTDAPSRRRSP